jgi:hypothetical protein
MQGITAAVDEIRAIDANDQRRAEPSIPEGSAHFRHQKAYKSNKLPSTENIKPLKHHHHQEAIEREAIMSPRLKETKPIPRRTIR